MNAKSFALMSPDTFCASKPHLPQMPRSLLEQQKQSVLPSSPELISWYPKGLSPLLSLSCFLLLNTRPPFPPEISLIPSFHCLTLATLIFLGALTRPGPHLITSWLPLPDSLH